MDTTTGTKCKCGKKATKIAMDSEVGPDLMCDNCAKTWIKAGNKNQATVFQVANVN